jgi:hypothetical protein
MTESYDVYLSMSLFSPYDCHVKGKDSTPPHLKYISEPAVDW